MEKIDFNKVYANKVSKEQFVEDHAHYGTPDELGKAWEDLQDKPDTKESAPVKGKAAKAPDTEGL